MFHRRPGCYFIFKILDYKGLLSPVGLLLYCPGNSDLCLSMKHRILIVDDEKTIAKALFRLFTHHNYTVDTADNGEDALKSALKKNYDLILLDIILPKMNGVEVLKKIKEKKPKVPIIMMTAYSNKEYLDMAQKLGAKEALLKPFVNIDEVLKTAQKYLR